MILNSKYGGFVFQTYRSVLCPYGPKCCLVAKLNRTLVSPWIAARQAPTSMEFSRQEYWSGLPFPSPGDLPDPGVVLTSLALAGFFNTEPPGKPYYAICPKWCVA